MAFISDGKIHIIDGNIQVHEESVFSSVSFSEARPNTMVAIDIDGAVWIRDGDKFAIIQFTIDVTFVSVVCGYEFITALDSGGYLWKWTYCDFASQNNLINGKLELDMRFVFMSCEFHIAGIDEEGNLWSSQPTQNIKSQTDETEGKSTYEVVMINISDLYKIKDVKFTSCSCDNNVTIAIDDTGKLWIYGCNDYERVIIDNIYGLNKIGSDNRFIALSSDCGETVALDENGILWAMGYNIYPEDVVVKDDTYLSELTKIKMNVTFTSITIYRGKIFALDGEGNIWTCTYSDGFKQIMNYKADRLFNQDSIVNRMVNIKSSATFLCCQ